MGMEYRNGQMVLNMKDNGSEIKCLEMGNFIIKMEIFMKELLLKIWHMVKVLFSNKMDQNM